MITVNQRKNGDRYIQFDIGGRPNGKRKTTVETIPLGKITARDADFVKGKIEQLITCKIIGTEKSVELSKWLADRPSIFYDKLVGVGLVQPRDDSKSAILLEPFIDEYITKVNHVKPATKEIWRQGKKGLIDFCGSRKMLSEITVGDAEDYLNRMRAKLAPYTISKRLQFANKIFNSAVDHKLIENNPFAKVKIKRTMKDRKHFISREDTEKLIKSAPNLDWELIISLSRWGGLRCPSEVLSLKISYIDWSNRKIKVYSPKTEHHQDGDFRIIPLFPELDDVLLRACKRGGTYVVDEKYRKASFAKAGWRNCNLRTTFEKIIKRAGLTKWERIFHNMRSSRQTELQKQFGAFTACKWMGNSIPIADRHYHQVTDEDCALASGLTLPAGGKQDLERCVQRCATESPAVAQSDIIDIQFANSSVISICQAETLFEKRRGWDSNPWWAVTPTPI